MKMGLWSITRRCADVGGAPLDSAEALEALRDCYRQKKAASIPILWRNLKQSATSRELWKAEKHTLRCQAENPYRGNAFLKSSQPSQVASFLDSTIP
jgi:hypothetical protein